MAIDDITERRWNKDDDPNNHRPIDALRVLADRIERGQIDVKHVVICVGFADKDGERSTAYYQAGCETPLGGIGLVTRTIALMTTGI